ncbi:MAG: hypothetical protein COB46_08330 [Rhodospirillaceae bacterium]|nr:MAG: hypothetical protein COB46_08330 [Rhodospirillaceae bacterium]
MEEFITFIYAAGLMVLAGAGWLIRWWLTKKTPTPAPQSVDGTEAMTALTEKYKNQIDDQGQTIDALRKAVDSLTEKQGTPDAPEGLNEALDHLKQGDTKKAEALFERILEAKEAEGQAANLEAAEAAKNIGALAYLHDTDKALNAYKKATKLNPDDAEAWNLLGALLLRSGDLTGAKRAFNKVLALGNRTTNKSLIAIASGNLGIIAQTQGDLDKSKITSNNPLPSLKNLAWKKPWPVIWAT